MARQKLEPTRFHVGADYIDMRAELEKAEANFVDLYGLVGGGGSDDDTAYATTAAMTTALAAKAATADLSSIAIAANTDIGMPNDGDVIHFDVGTGKWTRGAPSGGGVQDRMFAVNPPTNTLFPDYHWIKAVGGDSESDAATLTEHAGRAIITDPHAGTDSHGAKVFMRPIPSGMQSGNAFEFACRIQQIQRVTYAGAALVLRADNGRFVMLRIFNNGSNQMAVGENHGVDNGDWNDGTTVSLPIGAAPEWIKVAYDAAGNLSYSISADGYSWDVFATQTLSAMATAPTSYGVGTFRYASALVNPVAIPSFFSTELPLSY